MRSCFSAIHAIPVGGTRALYRGLLMVARHRDAYLRPWRVSEPCLTIQVQKLAKQLYENVRRLVLHAL